MSPSKSLLIPPTITNVKVKGERLIPNRKKIESSQEKKKKRNILKDYTVSQTIDSILTNKQKP